MLRSGVVFVGAFVSLNSPGTPAVGATCECKPEVNNASAVTSDTCSKTWKDSHCTLKESGASSRAASRSDMIAGLSGETLVPDTKFQSDLSAVRQKLDALRDTMGQLGIAQSDSALSDFNQIPLSYGNADDLMIARIKGEPIPAEYLFWSITDAMLISFPETEILSAVSVSLELAAQNDIMGFEVKNAALPGGKELRYGQGCLLYGDSSSYVSIDLNPVGFRCSEAFLGFN